MARNVHQILATLGYGDAIGNEVLGIHRALRAAGYQSEIIVETADPRLEHLTVDYRDIVGEDFILGLQSGVQQDMRIWHNKIHRKNPVLCEADDYLAEFRKWVRQFYCEPD